MLLGAIITFVLFLIDVYLLYLSPALEKKREADFQKKCDSSIETIKQNNTVWRFFTYPERILISVCGVNALIEAKYIDIKEECQAEEVTFDGVIQIINFKLKASKINFINSNYKEVDGVIFDNTDTLCFIYKAQSIKRLKELAQNYNIKRSALKYFTNASYIQFINKGILRISHPYNEVENTPKLVCPKRIDGIDVKGIEINYHNLDYIYINDMIKQVVYEVDCDIKRIDLPLSKYLKVRNNKLVYRKYNLIINHFNDVRKIDKNSPKYYYKPSFVMKKSITFCRKEEE